MKVNWQDNDAVSKIVDACVKGDRMSQELLYKSFYGKMATVCMRYAKKQRRSIRYFARRLCKSF